MPDQKKNSVAALQALNYKVVAAGDSFNDTTMLKQADHGILFHAPENVVKMFPQFPAVNEYADLMRLIVEKL
jgi:phosphoserine/homoserine phosphotransferase